MKAMRALLCVTLFFSLPVNAITFVSEDIISDPSPSHFSLCHDTSCVSITQLSLTVSQWNRVKNLFRPAAETPAGERENIRQAIALMEKITGAMAGTSNDLGENAGGAAEGQMDCIDESTNTTTYISMFARDRLLIFHTVSDPETRGYFFSGWPHTTAVIKDITDNHLYAVDSWFLDNGKPPFIIPIETWLNGWRPAGGR